MPDEPTVEPTATPETPTAEPTSEPTSEPTILGAPPEPTSVVNADGTFAENWRESLPEELRDEKCLDNVTDFSNAIKQLVNHKKMVGMDKIVVPTDKSTPAEWDAFYAALGRPATPQDYHVEIPEDMRDILTDDVVAADRKWAHENGVSDKLFQKFYARQIEQMNAMITADEEAERQAIVQARDALRQEFGAAYDQRMTQANRLIAEAIPDREKQLTFLEEFGNNPRFVRFACTIASRLGESEGLVSELTARTPGEAQTKIQELMDTPGYMDYGSDMSPQRRQAITDQIMELRREAAATRRVG